MHHTKLAIFLFIALASVATLGSSTPASDDSENFPDSEEIKAVRNRSKNSKLTTGTQEIQNQTGLISFDQGNKTSKTANRDPVDPGTVIAGASLAFEVLKSALGALGAESRKIAIGVDNESGREWKAINAYFSSGTSDKLLPRTVYSGEALVWGARKTSYSLRGAVGVFTYYIPSLIKTLAVMYSVPFDQVAWYSNQFNVKLYSGNIRASEKIFDELYDKSPFKADNGWHFGYLGYNLRFKGAMTSSGQATLQIRVKRMK